MRTFTGLEVTYVEVAEPKRGEKDIVYAEVGDGDQQGEYPEHGEEGIPVARQEVSKPKETPVHSGRAAQHRK